MGGTDTSSSRLREVLKNLESNGVSVSVAEGRLRISAPPGVVTPELRQELAEHKAEIVQLLTERDIPVPQERLSAPPLSLAQEGLWILYQLDPENASYHVPLCLNIRGPLDVEALRRALETIVSRHEPLRTRFVIRGGRAVQDVQPAGPLILPLLDLQGRSPESANRELETEASAPFDLTHENPFRVRLVRIAEQEHQLLLCVHHIAFDGWSLALLQRELGVCYTAFQSGRAPLLPPIPVRYSDYAASQRDSLAAVSAYEAHLDYWKRQLAGAAPLNLPLDRPRPARPSKAGTREPIVLPEPLVLSLRSLARSEKTTFFVVLLAALQVLLHRYANQSDICIGVPVANRTKRELENLIGLFTHTLVIRSDSSQNPSFSSFLAQVHESVLEAQEHQSVSLDKVTEEISSEQSTGEPPLVSVLFVLQNAPMRGAGVAGLDVTLTELDLKTSKADLTLSLEDFQGDLYGYLEYNTDVFEPATARRILRHYTTLLESVAANPRCRLSDLSLLRPAERQEILFDWNQTRQPYPESCVHQIFEGRAERTPDAIALTAGSEQVSYRDLNCRANRWAHYLRKQGVGPDVPVGLYLHRSIELITGMLAVLKAGGAYVPLDTGDPAERTAFLLNDAGIALLLTDRSLATQAPQQSGCRLLRLDEMADTPARGDIENLPNQTAPDDLAYIMYTSGSTGQPKGVEIPHRGIVRLLFGSGFAHFGPDDVLLHHSPPSFDASTLEVWAPLLHGGRCVLAPDSLPRFAELGSLIQRQGITTLWLTAALFHAIIEEAAPILAPVRQILAGGEALSITHVRRALSCLPSTQLINGYGPTENTTFTCCYPIPRDLADSVRSVPIGKPIGNTRVYILDSDRQPVPIGMPGELYIGGDGLARGYRGRPELTAEKFVPDVFTGRPGDRLYRSGDRVRYRDDGNIEFLGRLDQQVKLRGHRIELGEVEAALLQAGAQTAAALVRRDSPGTDQLIAFYVSRGGSLVSAEQLRLALQAKLPSYLVPSRLIQLEAMPQLSTGKLDRAALERWQLPSITRPVREPRDPIEALVAETMADLLHVEHMDADDDFFACGGHSLLAMQLMARLEEALGWSLPAGTLLKASTPSALAQVLRTTRGTLTSHCLVLSQPAGSNPPVFFLHSLDGDLLLYRPLILQMQPQQPAYGLSVNSLESELGTMHSVEALASHYLKEIRSVQPHGPYRLCGYSFGGVLAFEVARQLELLGETVGLLAILDTATYMLRIKWTLREKWALFRRWLAYRLKLMWRRGLPEIYDYFSHKIRHAWSGEPLVLGWVAPERHRLAAELLRLLDNYRPQPYHGPAVLFRASEREDTIELDPRNGWDKLVLGGVEVCSVPGDHLTFMKDPHVQALAAQIDRLLGDEGSAQPLSACHDKSQSGA